MKKVTLILIILCAIATHIQGQRSNVFAAFQLIESGKYEEAKEVIEEALEDDKTKSWSRTWYAKGLLCQKAYEQGIKDNDKKKYELYENQIFVAYESFEKSLAYKRNMRITDHLEPIYVQLANDFMVLGAKEYKEKKYEEAFKSYKNALEINESYIVSMALDSNLLYNTALAAFNSSKNKKAIEYLNRLNAVNYSPNVSHLLYLAYMASGDTINAESALIDGIDRYKKNEDLVLLFANMLFNSKDYEKSIHDLDIARKKYPNNYIYPYTKGLIFQKFEKYEQAIEAYKEAIKLNPDKLDSYCNLGTCYYNIGVEKEENARSINQNDLYQQELARSVSARKKAVSWLEKGLEKDAVNQTIREQLVELYVSLGMNEKIKELGP